MGKEKGEKYEVPGLVDLVFSWSLADIMNKDLYKHKVQQIPDTFLSARHYLSSFVGPLVAETHADLRSCMMDLGSLPVGEIHNIWESKDFSHPKNLLYMGTLEELPKSDEEGKENKKRNYEPECWDLIVISGLRPKRLEDLIREKRPYTVALVIKLPNIEDDGAFNFKILSSRLVDFGDEEKANKLFAVHITNLLTNIRIWSALHVDQKCANLRVLESVLRHNRDVEEGCMDCNDSETASDESMNVGELISSLELDDSQKAAVLDSVALTRCNHRSSVKLIWGPPGTGKTKTIASLAFTLLRMRCRTLICAPTNVAMTGVANRLMSFIRGSGYGLGDVLVFGNGKRMKIEEHEVLYDVFLQFRVLVLCNCLLRATGWVATLNELINLLSDPLGQYSRYLVEEEKKKNVKSDSLYLEEVEKKKKNDKRDSLHLKEEEKKKKNNKRDNVGVKNQFSRGNELVNWSGTLKDILERNIWKRIIIHNLKFNNKNRKRKMQFTVPDWVEDSLNAGNCSDVNDQGQAPWFFEEFFRKNFSSLRKRLILFMSGFYVHLPTKFLPKEVVMEAIRAFDMLKDLEILLHNVEGQMQRALLEMEETGSLCRARLECLNAMESLRNTFAVPDIHGELPITSFCLANSLLVFCTVSSSARLHTEANAVPLVIIDEAAQLKECESCIPLQLPGVQHAILVGDEKQLPAMVMNKACDNAGFGRSLFERMVKLGYKKHLLNVQYRMHPSISLFPNEKFYEKQIKNGENVMEKSYERRFLEESLFGTYSFINVSHGKEEFDNRHSQRNFVEASVVAEIVSKLYKESLKSKKKVSVGCISPYKAQVAAIQELLGKNYSTDAKNAFSVHARSVDGFQGGEQDVIIISTVRCNGNGSIGFLSNHQRTNVALTRARFCLWILGNEVTLLNSNSIWRKLVMDAKDRGCCYNAHDDKNLSAAISNALVKVERLDSLFSMDSILFKAAMWKVCFSSRFHDSMIRYRGAGIHNEVANILGKLSQGWRPERNAKAACDTELASFELLEWCDVTKRLKLVWTIEILREGLTEIQVMKVLDILAQGEISRKAKEFEVLFGNYTVNQMQRCRCKCMEGGLMLPMSWTVDSDEGCAYSSSDTLVNQMGTMSLRDMGKSSDVDDKKNSDEDIGKEKKLIWYKGKSSEVDDKKNSGDKIGKGKKSVRYKGKCSIVNGKKNSSDEIANGKKSLKDKGKSSDVNGKKNTGDEIGKGKKGKSSDVYGKKNSGDDEIGKGKNSVSNKRNNSDVNGKKNSGEDIGKETKLIRDKEKSTDVDGKKNSGDDEIGKGKNSVSNKGNISDVNGKKNCGEDIGKETKLIRDKGKSTDIDGKKNSGDEIGNGKKSTRDKGKNTNDQGQCKIM